MKVPNHLNQAQRQDNRLAAVLLVDDFRGQILAASRKAQSDVASIEGTQFWCRRLTGDDCRKPGSST